MASEWRSSTWGDEISLEYGKSLRGYDAAHGEYRVFGSNGPIGWTREPLAPGPGVILGRKGAYRGVQYSPEPFYVIDTAYYVVPKTELDMRWLYYAIRHYRLGDVDDGSPIPSTTRSAVYVLDLDVPPPDEQRAIAHILGTLDDKIELNRRTNETLEAIARALFKSWFVDFDPVRAKSEGRDPGLPPHLADLFPDSFEDSEVGEIPKGWRVGKAGELAVLTRDACTPGDFPEETFDHFSIPAFDNGCMPKVETGASIRSIKFLVPDGSVLVSKLNPRIPRIWMPTPEGSRRAVCSTEFLVALPRAGVSREFLFCLFSSDAFASVFETLVNGTSGSHQRVRPEGFFAMEVAIPGEEVVRQFTNVVRPTLECVDCTRAESDSLVALRDTLLPRLIAGDLRVC